MFEDIGGGFSTNTIDESMQTPGAEVAGGPVASNNVRSIWTQSASKSLVYLWFAVLALYWALGYLFRGKRGGK